MGEISPSHGKCRETLRSSQLVFCDFLKKGFSEFIFKPLSDDFGDGFPKCCDIQPLFFADHIHSLFSQAIQLGFFFVDGHMGAMVHGFLGGVDDELAMVHGFLGGVDDELLFIRRQLHKEIVVHDQGQADQLMPGQHNVFLQFIELLGPYGIERILLAVYHPLPQGVEEFRKRDRGWVGDLD